ncbi:T-box transcription factor TBX20-like isoform X2 [Mercenaria mercenaria]|uniref:T-box transcription factor TBX20-like isoform X2 n=1 Tax=Mercenaria mercenaria TaxID=6596 RepID=UPI00234ECFBC|nr:T-box transcription factor TBX20-like isoform X2 [Mercenaria mercenaria]
MSQLSAKARAFSVDELLGKKEKETTSKAAKYNSKLSPDGEEICPFMGDDPNCRHKSSVEFLEKQGDVLKIELCQSELWHAFHTLGTEMIITKTGRRMFPAVRIRISGLKKTARYKVSMDFIPVDKNKYRYVYHSSRWMVSGVGDSIKQNQTYEHPESPMTGEYMTSQVISFEKIKLTNHEKPSTGQISLLSMQKFQPRIMIQEKGSSCTSDSQITVTFPQTSFIAVTAYQNQEITRLKIARNPFAKGFREAGKCSSLEAMMASFGVVIDANQGHCSPQGKRRFEEPHELDSAELSPPKQAMWHSPMFVDHRLSNHMLMYPPMLFHPNQFLAAQHTVSQNICKINDDVNKETDKVEGVKTKSSSSTSDISISSSSSFSPSSSVSYLSSMSPVSPPPVYHHNPEIHPAFPYTSGIQSPSIDSQALAVYYKGLLQNPSYQNVMFLPSTMFSSSSGPTYDHHNSSSRKLNTVEDNNNTAKLNTS